MEVNEQIEVPMSLDGTLKDPKFIGYVEIEIKKVQHRRTEFLNQNPGLRFKRSAFSDLEDKGMLTAKKLIYAFHQINNRESGLSSRERRFVSEVVISAMVAILDVTKKKAK